MGVTMTDLVKLKSPQGTTVTVPSEQASKLKAQGYRSPVGRPPKPKADAKTDKK